MNNTQATVVVKNIGKNSMIDENGGSDIIEENNDIKKSSKFPLSINRNILIIIYILFGTVSGTFFFNWPAAQKMYLNFGAYKNICSNIDEFCPERISAVNSLMPAGVAGMFVSSLLGGFLLDYFGPQITTLFGISSQITGWMLILCCNDSLLLAIILIGVGSDPILLALLNGAHLYPHKKLTVMSIIASSRSLSYAIPSIINILFNNNIITYKHVCVTYIFLLISCLIGVILFIPVNCFTSSTPSIPIPTIVTPPLEKFIKRNTSFSSLPTLAGSSVSSRTSIRTFIMPAEFGPSRALKNKYDDDISFENMSQIIYKNNKININEETPQITKKDAPWINVPLYYLFLFPLAATTILSETFYAISSHLQLDDATNFSILITPLTMLPTILLGMLADYKNPLITMYIANIFNLILFLLLLLKTNCPILAYTAAIFGSLSASFSLVQFYCYIASVFSEKYFGRSIGFLTIFSGLVSLAATPMCDFSSFEENFQPMNGLCLSVTTFNFVWLVLLTKFNKTS